MSQFKSPFPQLPHEGQQPVYPLSAVEPVIKMRKPSYAKQEEAVSLPRLEPYKQLTSQSPRDKRRERKEIIVTVSIILTILAVVLGIGLVYVVFNSNSSSIYNSSNTSTTSGSAATWTTTHTFTGNGDKKTEIFSVPSDWKILYICTYQKIDSVTDDGSLGVSVYGADGSVVDPGAISVTCKNGVAQTTGETEEHQAGQVYLSIYGTGDWTVQVQELR